MTRLSKITGRSGKARKPAALPTAVAVPDSSIQGIAKQDTLAQDTIVQDTGSQDTGVQDTGSQDMAFVAAMRHSRRVRFLRKAIPLACIGGVLGPILWGVIAPLARTVPDVKVGAISVSGTKIKMESPKLSGFKKDQKSYELTALEAIQDIKQPTVVELNKLNGRMEQDKNSFARLTADWGRFDQTADKLDLKGSVRLRTDNGYEADLTSARVDMKSGDISSQEPVEIRSKAGSINADRMLIRENGKHSVFEGRVKSVFIQNDPPAESTPEAAKP
jgi:lipopolysaccharide export system protein LptC